MCFKACVFNGAVMLIAKVVKESSLFKPINVYAWHGTQTAFASSAHQANKPSDMKYGVKEWGSINGVPPLINCLEKKPTFECHPSTEQVLNKIKELI